MKGREGRGDEKVERLAKLEKLVAGSILFLLIDISGIRITMGNTGIGVQEKNQVAPPPKFL